MPVDIEITLTEALSADTALTALIGDNLFPEQVPEDEDSPPWLYFSIPDSVPFDALDSDEGIDVRSEAEFHALGDRYSTASKIIKRVIAVLEGLVAHGQIKQVFWAGTSKETTEEGYHQAARFTVLWVKTA